MVNINNIKKKFNFRFKYMKKKNINDIKLALTKIKNIFTITDSF